MIKIFYALVLLQNIILMVHSNFDALNVICTFITAVCMAVIFYLNRK